jgi:hypothetical protein
MAEVLTYDPSNDPQAIAAAEERDAESLAIGEQMEAEQQELLAGKYKSAQDLEKAYMELQRKLGEGDTDAGEEAEPVEEEAEPAESSPVAEFINSAADEYAESGQLSEETLEAFSEMTSRELVEAYMQMEGQVGSMGAPGVELSDQEISSIQDTVGGAEQYQVLTDWAGDNLSEAEVEAYNDLVATGNAAAINLALRGLYSQYTDVMGYEGETLQGKPAAPRDGYRSQAEVVRAMSDPRYDRDPAYRTEVMEKLERSDIEF